MGENVNAVTFPNQENGFHQQVEFHMDKVTVTMGKWLPNQSMYQCHYGVSYTTAKGAKLDIKCSFQRIPCGMCRGGNRGSGARFLTL